MQAPTPSNGPSTSQSSAPLAQPSAAPHQSSEPSTPLAKPTAQPSPNSFTAGPELNRSFTIVDVDAEENEDSDVDEPRKFSSNFVHAFF